MRQFKVEHKSSQEVLKNILTKCRIEPKCTSWEEQTMTSEKLNMLKACLFLLKVSLEYCNRMNLILLSNFRGYLAVKSGTCESTVHLELFFF